MIFGHKLTRGMYKWIILFRLLEMLVICYTGRAIFENHYNITKLLLDYIPTDILVLCSSWKKTTTICKIRIWFQMTYLLPVQTSSTTYPQLLSQVLIIPSYVLLIHYLAIIRRNDTKFKQSLQSNQTTGLPFWSFLIHFTQFTRSECPINVSMTFAWPWKQYKPWRYMKKFRRYTMNNGIQSNLS